MGNSQSLIHAVEHLSADLRELIHALDVKPPVAAPPCQLCLVCQSYHNGQFEPACRSCIQNGWADFCHIDGKAPFWKGKKN